MNKERVLTYLQGLQDSICKGLEEIDGKALFHEDKWEHHAGGGGRSRVITHGSIFEKGGVNFSAVEGLIPTFMRNQVSENATRFFATGVSIVIHPYNPHVPIIHMNVRYFESDAGDCWFGGGIDLTPIYIRKDQAREFHTTLKNVCDAFDANAYSEYKQLADDYFFNQHRKETRGVGGIFYDYLRPEAHRSWDELFAFMQNVGNAFLQCYLPIVAANHNLSFSEKEKQWQLIRRGRYVEFNLVYDRGTRFGLETSGRIESILMSLPEHASWIYNHQPEAGSAEEETLLLLKKGIEWT